MMIIDIARPHPGSGGANTIRLYVTTIEDDTLVPGHVVLRLASPTRIEDQPGAALIACEVSVRPADIVSCFRGEMEVDPVAQAAEASRAMGDGARSEAAKNGRG
jgi:hypothetical protein